MIQLEEFFINDEINEADMASVMEEMREKEEVNFQILKDSIDYFQTHGVYELTDEEIEIILEGEHTHIGYCEVKPAGRFGNDYEIIGKEVNGVNIPNVERQENDYYEDRHVLIYQRCIHEDGFYGFILYPLKDGRYWVLEFDM